MREATLPEKLARSKELVIEAALQEVLKQRPDYFNRFQDENPRRLIEDSVSRMLELDSVARRRSHLPKTAEEAEKIKALLVFSAPGTYLQPFKNDRYAQWSWSEWMDKRRIDYAAWLARKLTEIKTGEDLSNDPMKFHDAIKEDGPYLLYSGREDERADLLEALSLPHVKFPTEKLIVLGGEIDNTIDQVRELCIPEAVGVTTSDKVGLVMHSPQLVRTMHVMQGVLQDNTEAKSAKVEIPYPNFPFGSKGPSVKAFPLVSPSLENVAMEVAGIVYYSRYADPPQASLAPIAYEL